MILKSFLQVYFLQYICIYVCLPAYVCVCVCACVNHIFRKKYNIFCCFLLFYCSVFFYLIITFTRNFKYLSCFSHNLFLVTCAWLKKNYICKIASVISPLSQVRWEYQYFCFFTFIFCIFIFLLVAFSYDYYNDRKFLRN